MRFPRPPALALLLVAALAAGASRHASAGDLSSSCEKDCPVELVLTEEGSETPLLAPGDQVTLIVPDLEEATVAEVPDGLFVEQSGTTVAVEPGGSTYTIGDVKDDAYPVVVAKLIKIPLIGTINVASTKKPK